MPAQENHSDRPNKRPRLGLSENDQPKKVASRTDGESSKEAKNPVDKTEVKGKKAAQLDEFMEVMQPRTKKGRSWANEDTVAPNAEIQAESSTAASTVKSKKSKKKVAEYARQVSEEPGQEQLDLDDIEWMKRRMTKALDVEVEAVEEKAFEQDDEDQVMEEEEVKVSGMPDSL